jgi:hypothetical protein
VNVALRAGELVLGLVRPEELGLHVQQAIEVGGAQANRAWNGLLNDADPAGRQ